MSARSTRHFAGTLLLCAVTFGRRIMSDAATSLLQSGYSRGPDVTSPLTIDFEEGQDDESRSASNCDPGFITFDEFVMTHKRKYKPGSEEYQMRRELFESRVAEFKDHNCRSGKRLWTAGVTTLTDRTNAELDRLRGRKGHHDGVTSGGRVPVSGGASGPRLATLEGSSAKLRPIPLAFDGWKDLPAMKQVLDQGSCGSCWASASAVMLRAHTDIYTTDMPFSVQQLVSCVPNPQQCGGSGGCNGSTGELALDYVMHNGLLTSDQFAYQADPNSTWYKFPTLKEEEKEKDLDSHQGVPCPPAMVAVNALPTPQPNGTAYHRLPTLAVNQSVVADSPLMSMPASPIADVSAARSFGMLGWSKLPANRVEPLYRAVYQEGPVAVSITAGYSWNAYVSGIMDNCTNKDMVVNHLVVLVGWGFDYDKGDMVKYWTLQNSWGEGWGEKGFIRMIRQQEDDDEEGHCGWDHDPQIGTGCVGGPSKVWVCGSCGILYDNVVAHFEGTTTMAQEMNARRGW